MAPRPDLFAACPTAVRMLEIIPPLLHEEPDIRAAIYAEAKETERQEATMAALIGELLPQTATEVGLPWHERQYRVSPSGDVPARQGTLLAVARKGTGLMTGVDWQDGVTLILGTTAWTYLEHVEGDPATPDAGVLRIIIPFNPSYYDYDRAETLIGEVTPVGWDLELIFEGGFVLGEDELGEGAI